MRLIGRIWIVTLCALLLVACGTDEAPDPADVPASPPAVGDATATPASIPEMEIGPIIWAQELDPETGEPQVIVNRFSTESPAIIAVIEVNQLPKDTEFTAVWTINGQPIDGSDMQITAQADLEHSWIVFRFTRDVEQLYPIGQLNVVITSSEGDLREGSVEIGFP